EKPTVENENDGKDGTADGNPSPGNVERRFEEASGSFAYAASSCRATQVSPIPMCRATAGASPPRGSFEYPHRHNRDSPARESDAALRLATPSRRERTAPTGRCSA